MERTITLAEIKELIKESGRDPSYFFSKQDFLNDKKLMKSYENDMNMKELEAYRAKEREKEETKENELIPD